MIERPTLSDRVIFVLVRPQHPGNVGAACRAMKNMGFHRLRIVSDQLDLEKARWMAPGAQDILEQATIASSLELAIDDVAAVIGTTSRVRHWNYPIIPPRALGHYLQQRCQVQQVALLFGQEDSGLDNDATGRCECLVQIPTAGLKSLNLSQAVLILAYELLLSRYPSVEADSRKLSTFSERERLVDSITTLSERTDFMKGRNIDQLRATLRGISGRMLLDSREVQLMLGFLRKVGWHLAQVPTLPPTPNQED